MLQGAKEGYDDDNYDRMKHSNVYNEIWQEIKLGSLVVCLHNNNYFQSFQNLLMMT